MGSRAARLDWNADAIWLQWAMFEQSEAKQGRFGTSRCSFSTLVIASSMQLELRSTLPKVTFAEALSSNDELRVRLSARSQDAWTSC